jgi:hypothetical protein
MNHHAPTELLRARLASWDGPAVADPDNPAASAHPPARPVAVDPTPGQRI